MSIVRYHPRAAVGDGGITGSVRRWSRSTAAQGRGAVIAYDRAGDHPTIPGVAWVRVPHLGPEGWRVPTGLGDALRGAEVLVLHSAWSLHNAAAARVARGLGVPYLLEPRGAYDPGIVARHGRRRRLWWRALERGVVTGAAAIHVFFADEVEHLRRIGYAGPVVEAPNGVEYPDGVAWDGGSGDYLLWIGRFDPEHKGLDLLLQGLARMAPAERPRVRLHGPDWRGGRERTRGLVRSLGLEGWVTLGDPVYGGEKWELIRRARAFAYPSRWEAFGNSLGEAVAVGVPTLATPYPLARALAARGAALVAERTPRAMAEGIRRVLSGEAAALGRAGPRVVRDEFSWPAVARRWLHQVDEVLP